MYVTGGASYVDYCGVGRVAELHVADVPFPKAFSVVFSGTDHRSKRNSPRP